MAISAVTTSRRRIWRWHEDGGISCRSAPPAGAAACNRADVTSSPAIASPVRTRCSPDSSQCPKSGDAPDKELPRHGGRRDEVTEAFRRAYTERTGDVKGARTSGRQRDLRLAAYPRNTVGQARPVRRLGSPGRFGVDAHQGSWDETSPTSSAFVRSEHSFGYLWVVAVT